MTVAQALPMRLEAERRWQWRAMWGTSRLNPLCASHCDGKVGIAGGLEGAGNDEQSAMNITKNQDSQLHESEQVLGVETWGWRDADAGGGEGDDFLGRRLVKKQADLRPPGHDESLDGMGAVEVDDSCSNCAHRLGRAGLD